MKKGLFELLATTTAKEWAIWREYEKLDPFGNDRLDWLLGTVAAAPQNLFVAKGETPTQPLDMVPDWGGLRAIEDAERRKAAAAEPDDTAARWREWREAASAIEEARLHGE